MLGTLFIRGVIYKLKSLGIPHSEAVDMAFDFYNQGDYDKAYSKYIKYEDTLDLAVADEDEAEEAANAQFDAAVASFIDGYNSDISEAISDAKRSSWNDPEVQRRIDSIQY
jgi:hypothetical protein